MIVYYEKAYAGYWFYYSIGSLNYAVIYPTKNAFLAAKKWNDIQFKPIAKK